MSEALSVQPEGTWTAPSPEVAQQIATLSPEQRAAQAEFLRDRYPRDRAAIEQAYGVTPSAQPTQAQKFDAMFPEARPDQIGLTNAERSLMLDGNAPPDVAAFTADLKHGLAATGMPAPIASAVGEGMINNARAAAGNEEAIDARWASRDRPTIERLARLPDGSPATWEQVKEAVHKALENVPAELREEMIASRALSSAGVVLQLFQHGLRQLQRGKFAAQP
jgi:hypothetical protein